MQPTPDLQAPRATTLTSSPGSAGSKNPRRTSPCRNTDRKKRTTVLKTQVGLSARTH